MIFQLPAEPQLDVDDDADLYDDKVRIICYNFYLINIYLSYRALKIHEE